MLSDYYFFRHMRKTQCKQAFFQAGHFTAEKYTCTLIQVVQLSKLPQIFCIFIYLYTLCTAIFFYTYQATNRSPDIYGKITVGIAAI